MRDTVERCSCCGLPKLLEEFHKNKTRVNGRDGRCKGCSNRHHARYYRANKEKKRAYSKDWWRENKRRVNRTRAAHRKDPANRAKFIVKDAGDADRKKGLENDLSEDFVRNLLVGGCSYCGETELQLTLDRTDNTVGHVTTNVTVACLRCNMLRRDMPFAAWKFLVPSIRRARTKGLFENWSGGVWQ